MRIVLMLVAAIALSGCGANLRKPSDSAAKAAVSKSTYARDNRTGQCFAVLETSRFMSVNASGATITYVPCTPEVLALIGK